MEMTLADAAKATKRTKQALAQAIHKGRLSATKDGQGVWRVDSAELFRAYPPEAKVEQQDPDNDLELLRTRLSTLEALHQADRELIEELRRARDSWQAQAERLALTSTAGKPSELPAIALQAAPQPEGQDAGQKPRKRGFWRSIFGGGE